MYDFTFLSILLSDEHLFDLQIFLDQTGCTCSDLWHLWLIKKLCHNCMKNVRDTFVLKVCEISIEIANERVLKGSKNFSVDARAHVQL